MRHDWQHGPQGPHRTHAPEMVLEIVRGRARHRFRPVTGPVFVLGTALDSDLVLGAPQFPEAHSYIMRGADGVRIKHLGAPPALSVNGQVTSGVCLSDGDRIRIGPYELVARIASHASDGTGLRLTDESIARATEQRTGANIEKQSHLDLKLHRPPS